MNLAVGNGVHVFCQGTIGVGAVAHGDHVLGLVCHKVVRISGGELCKQNDIVHLLHTVGSLCGNAAERDSGKTQYCTQHHWKWFRESMFFHLFSPVRTGFGLSWYNTSIIPYGGAFPQWKHCTKPRAILWQKSFFSEICKKHLTSFSSSCIIAYVTYQKHRI